MLILIYLDNAATTKVRAEVLEAMLPYLQEQYGNPSSVYGLGREAHHALDIAREQLKTALGAKLAREIFFTGCGTESDNWAISGVAMRCGKKGGISSRARWNTMPCWIPAMRWRRMATR